MDRREASLLRECTKQRRAQVLRRGAVGVRFEGFDQLRAQLLHGRRRPERVRYTITPPNLDAKSLRFAFDSLNEIEFVPRRKKARALRAPLQRRNRLGFL